MAGLECVILAGGFARRLLPLTESTPKPLLPLVGRPILSYTVDKLRRVEGLGRCYLTTNRRFAAQFSDFIARECGGLDIELFVEDAESEGQKLGSVAALGHLASRKALAKDTLVVGGDNLFDLELSELAAFQRAVRTSVVALYDIGSRRRASLYGVVKLDEGGRVVSFKEKPKEPPSTLVSTACYIFTGADIGLLNVYLEGGNPRDAAGHFVAWLARRRPVHGLPFTGMWYDIGSLESYNEADRFLRERLRAARARGPD
ncbi:MAG: nucleotidyltransferase family protein [Thermoplasmatota archaeon]